MIGNATTGFGNVNTAGQPRGGGGGTADAWFDQTVAAMKVLLPAASPGMRFEPLKLGQYGLAAPAAAANVTGGAVGVASDSTYLKYMLASVWPTPRTDAIAVGFRVKFPAIATSKISLISICVHAAAGNVDFGWVHATSATKWCLFPTGGTPVVSSFNADALWHTVIIALDGTNGVPIIVSMDGVVVATSADVPTLTNSPCSPAAFSSASLTPGATVSRIVYGYTDPT